MFIPSYNNGNILLQCKMCGQLTFFHNESICDQCNAIMKASAMMESGGTNKSDGLQSENLLLDIYYKRDIKISFSHNEQKKILYYTAMMIPNKDNWLEGKIKESELEMKKTGFKNISLKMIGNFSEMKDYEVTTFMNERNSTLMTSPYVIVPLILERWGSAKGRDWSGFWWKLLNVFILLLSIMMTVSSAFLIGFFNWLFNLS